MAEFRMPILGADMRAGTLVAWKKRVGEHLARGEVIAEVETDKGNIDVEVFTPGVLERLLVEPGTEVPVGTPLATIVEEGAAAAIPTPAVAPPVAPPTVTPPPIERAPIAPPAPSPAGRVRASPAARQLARTRGVDLAALHGTGPGGAITIEDVEHAAGAVAALPTPVDRMAGMRRAIAAAMARSKREIPHYYLGSTIDMKAALDWLTVENERRPMEARILPGTLLLKAVALALRETPELNAVWEGDHAVEKSAIHVGVAIALRGGGLVAPALHDTDRRSLDDLGAALRDLVARARAGSLRSSELADATITVTNLGEQGAESAFGVIYPPQVAIVGFGRIATRPWCDDGQVVARPLVTATLSADHRVSDGHRGGRFLAAVDKHLQRPEKL